MAKEQEKKRPLTVKEMAAMGREGPCEGYDEETKERNSDSRSTGALAQQEVFVYLIQAEDGGSVRTGNSMPPGQPEID